MTRAMIGWVLVFLSWYTLCAMMTMFTVSGGKWPKWWFGLALFFIWWLVWPAFGLFVLLGVVGQHLGWMPSSNGKNQPH